jgi:hypothetical protein
MKRGPAPAVDIDIVQEKLFGPAGFSPVQEGPDIVFFLRFFYRRHGRRHGRRLYRSGRGSTGASSDCEENYADAEKNNTKPKFNVPHTSFSTKKGREN